MSNAAAIKRVMNAINKSYGEGTIVLGSEAKKLKVRRIKSGIFELDYELGGGFPLKRIVQIHGPFSSGKTSIAFKLASSVQKKKQKFMVGYIEVEGTLDIDWAKTLGIDEDKLVLPPEVPNGQAALNIAEELVKTGEFGLVVIDSLAQVTPQEEIDNPVEKWTMGLQARLINKWIRKIVPALHVKAEDGTDNECILLILNQERDSMDQYAPPITPGGRGKDFAASINVQIRKGDWIDNGKTGSAKKSVGHEIKFNVRKNKTFARARTGVMDFYFSDAVSSGMKKGQFDNIKSIVLKSVDLGLIIRAGAFYKYKGKKYQGQKRLVEALEKSPATLKSLRIALYRDLKGLKNKKVIKRKK